MMGPTTAGIVQDIVLHHYLSTSSIRSWSCECLVSALFMRINPNITVSVRHDYIIFVRNYGPRVTYARLTIKVESTKANNTFVFTVKYFFKRYLFLGNTKGLWLRFFQSKQIFIFFLGFFQSLMQVVVLIIWILWRRLQNESFKRLDKK